MSQVILNPVKLTVKTESQVIVWSSLLSHPQALPVSPGTSKGGFSSLFVTPFSELQD